MYSLVFFTDNKLCVKTFDMGLSLLYLNFLSSIIIAFNYVLPFLCISALLVFNRSSIIFHHDHIIVYIVFS